MKTVQVNEIETMYVCLGCGSPSVEYSSLVGGAASCKACGWSGTREDLVAVPVVRDGLAGSDQVFLTMYNDFRKIFSTNARPFVLFFVKWGLVEAVQQGKSVSVKDPKLVLRYLNAIFQGALRAVLETREAIEKEKSDVD